MLIATPKSKQQRLNSGVDQEKYPPEHQNIKMSPLREILDFVFGND